MRAVAASLRALAWIAGGILASSAFVATVALAQGLAPLGCAIQEGEALDASLLLLVELGFLEADDPRFASRPARVENYDALAAALQARFATRPRGEWLALLGANDVPSGPINSIEEVFADPQVEALGLKVSLPHPRRGSVSVVANPVRFSATPARHATSAPDLGADNDAILKGEPAVWL
jgi:crotonobetainyl-CoA:carnitine CoA-transferase CaiB-like acyl-CoA transferase